MTIAQPPRQFSLEDRFITEQGPIYLTGIQALVRLALDQRRTDQRRGLNTAGLISGYPGSPIGGFDIELNRRTKLLEEHHVRLLPGLNEDLAATALWGSQMVQAVDKAKYDGVYAMWFGKAPGVDRSADALRHGNIRGTAEKGGVLVVAGDDPQPNSSMFPSDSNGMFVDLKMPLLFPGDVQEIIDLGLHGYALSRAAGLWVGFKIVASLADSAGTALVSPDRIVPIIPSVELDGRPYKPVLRLNEAGAPMRDAERDLHYARLEIARRYGYENKLNRIVYDVPDAKIGIVAAGKTYFDLRQALRDLGLDESELKRLGIRLLQVRMLFPLDQRTIDEFAEGLEEIIVIEEKRSFLEAFIKEALYSGPHRPIVVGKSEEDGTTLVQAFGDLDADLIARALAKRLQRRFELPSAARRIEFLDKNRQQPIQLSTARAPYFCSGCPHSTSLVAPDGAIVGAGIGCHVMALYMGKENFGNVIGYTQMGGEGAQFVGLSPYTEHQHFFQNLGDGTFTHSGSLAIRFAISSGANITYKLLYNQAISMTGGQSIQGGMTVEQIVRMLDAEGVRRIVITTDDISRYKGVSLPASASVRPRGEILEVEKELAKVPGVTVLIHDQQCAAEKRRLRKRGKLAAPEKSILINERVCEGCGDCGRKSNCLSVQPVETEFGRKTQIEQSSCNKDFSCIRGDCPSFLTVEGAVAKQPASRPAIRFDDKLPDPVPHSSGETFGLRMCGIGGTGVVTANQILCTAAVIDGFNVRGLDLTGFSQKAGPVVSEMQLFRDGDVARSNTLSAGSADLYLVFDPLVGVDAANLAKTSPEGTVAVVSMSKVPTGRMVADINTRYPDQTLLRRRIEKSTRASDNVYLDAQRIAATLIGDHMAGNMIVIGAAYQTGRLPLSEEAIAQAIRLNGAAVEMNLLAFRLGRLSVADPARLNALMEERSGKPEATLIPSAEVQRIVDATAATGELKRLLQIRVAELEAYQNLRYARSYAEFVGKVLSVEQDVVPGSTRLTEAVARYLYKFMAYKDEYEVARLLLAQRDNGEIEEMFGKGVRYYWHLHPTFLRSLGVKNKVKFGSWLAPLLRIVRGMKRLRGGPFDFFGIGEVRRTERALMKEYREVIEAALGVLSTENHAAIVKMAELPDIVRGYEDVKLDAVKTYSVRLSAAKAELGVAAPMPEAEAPVVGRAA
ncbi:indolepyruvate ferredoxin oxidoreductase family protein [Chelativorans sp. Marseille-P2723]|uniref:indolepyruvate ferredoxin oxidoreductase family protein n=1 Tax=Chelativorans sp. Marseille-P2723 TaxID=2709133 RepID=UPI00157022B1|nr:indolepyruvate ferredoxin oxidoreductase family protein [Chelativorans sp. Marseille-P2723]